MTAAAQTATKVMESKVGTGGGVGTGSSENTSPSDQAAGLKRKQSEVYMTTAGEIDLSLLPPPRAGRPLRNANADPGMQEARKRARVLRNRAAAQLSREKKRMHLEQLEQENEELRAKNELLEQRLGRAEDANADLSARLDSLAKQMQSFQNLVLGSENTQQHHHQQHSGAGAISPIVDWSSVTPLVASPLLQACASTAACTPVPGRSNSTNSILSFTNATSTTPVTATPRTSTPSASPTSSLASSCLVTPKAAEVVSASPSILSSIAGATLPSPATMEPSSAVMELFPNIVAGSSDLADKGLSESAALVQSDAHTSVESDSQQRMSLSHMQSISRPQHRQQSPFSEAASEAAMATMLETYSLTSSSMNWAQRMVSMAVMAVVSASTDSSPQTLWTIFCVLWWVLSQSGGSISRHQLSRIARGISECTPHRATNMPGVKSNRGRSVGTASTLTSSDTGGLASLELISSWLGRGSRTGMALRRVAGDEPVDQASSSKKLSSTSASVTSPRTPRSTRSAGPALMTEAEAEAALLMLASPRRREKEIKRLKEQFEISGKEQPASVTGSNAESEDEPFLSAEESPANALGTQKDDMGEISDLSDVEDPHFSAVMTKAGESAMPTALVDAEEVPAESVDVENQPTVKGTHIVFGSDVELSDDDEDNDSQKVEKPARNSDDDEDDNDEAPEVLGAKRAESENPTTEATEDLPQQSSETKSAKKRRRSRKRKAAASADSESKEVGKAVRSKVEEAIAKMSIRPEFEMPKEIPEELRIDLAAHAQQAALKRKKLAEDGSSAKASDGKIDMSVLEQFTSETVSQKTDHKKEGVSSKKSKKAKKAQRSDAERVVDGIRVVASNKRESPTSLLDSLAQAVPRKVMGFAIQKTGGKRVRHADPLVGIARKRGISSIHFLKN
ncbi:hypothetical protein GGI15_004407 [Coemansia interrupta]|uniref:BZIP domain-containing protein n=1 Tax=Coemansia interrupta TaxID=1126814 RepID=A0A9W8H958_9FUNG|nr:hypothetical protein GGI15_004407 [Coemansia interrupta]